MSNFDEKSGIVTRATDWGQWWQTTEEVYVEIVNDSPITSRNVRCEINTQSLLCVINGKQVIKGKLYGIVKADDSVWTIEDKRNLRVLLSKAKPGADNCWRALFASDGKTGDTYEADPFTADQMQRKLTLERFQNDQPGFDFSGAEISGNYQDGGPQLPT